MITCKVKKRRKYASLEGWLLKLLNRIKEHEANRSNSLPGTFLLERSEVI